MAKPPISPASTGAVPAPLNPARPPLALGPLTKAGQVLAAWSPLGQALDKIAAQPAKDKATSARARREARELLNRAARLDAEGRRGDAIAALRAATQLTPDDAVAHFNLGLTCYKANRARDAVISLRQAVGLQPDFGRAQFRLGAALQDLGQTDDAIAALRTAIALKTNLKAAHARLGDLLWAAGDLSAAADSFRRATDDTATGRLQRAKAAMVDGDFVAAEAAARHALARDPANAEVRWMLGNVLVTLGRFDEAVRHCDRATELSPDAVTAYYTRVNARRLTEADRPVVNRMLKLLQSASLNNMERMRLGYALGKAFDDLKDHASAIQHFDAANRIEKTMTSYDRTQLAGWVALLIERCTPDYFARHAALGSDDETPLFILGMPRSGTTLTEQIVSSHPQVVGGDELEFWLRRGPDWEHNGPDGLTPPAIGRLAADYRAVLRRIAPDAARVTDKMPHNFMWIGLIHLVFPKARIIHCRRHPADTCLSIYFTHFLRTMSFASDRSDLVHEYRQYERLMAHWRAVLPADRFLEVDYEALTADRESWTRRLIAFAGLEWDDVCLRPEDNERIVKTASVWQARQPVYRTSVARWRNYEPWLGELRALLSPEALATT